MMSALRQKEETRRLKVEFQGRVQGVGFRYTVCSLAGEYPLSGFVRNEWDGSVHMEVEGQQEHLEHFLLDIRNSRLREYISHIHQHWSDPTGRDSGFRIKF